jgi:hypothetical protein
MRVAHSVVFRTAFEELHVALCDTKTRSLQMRPHSNQQLWENGTWSVECSRATTKIDILLITSQWLIQLLNRDVFAATSEAIRPVQLYQMRTFRNT